MKPRPDADVVWVPVSEVAHEYNRCTLTIRRWCQEGYAITLGYKVKKDVTGHWLIGVPHSEYRTFRTANPCQAPAV